MLCVSAHFRCGQELLSRLERQFEINVWCCAVVFPKVGMAHKWLTENPAKPSGQHSLRLLGSSSLLLLLDVGASLVSTGQDGLGNCNWPVKQMIWCVFQQT